MTDTVEMIDPDWGDHRSEAAAGAGTAAGRGLVGPGGLLAGLTKTVLETALEAEMTEHLGHERQRPAS